MAKKKPSTADTGMTATGLEVRVIQIDDAQPAPYNPRIELKPGDKEWEALARSLEEFGPVEPLVWNKRTGHLVGGHQRFAILKARGDTHVTVSVVDLSLEKEKALNLALNKIEGKWDTPKVVNVLSELLTSDIDLAITGFEPEEMAALASAMDEQMFTPVTPVLEARGPVEQATVHRAAEQERGRFTRQTEVRDITCPHCGGIFGLGGEMAELAAKTPGLKVS